MMARGSSMKQWYWNSWSEVDPAYPAWDFSYLNACRIVPLFATVSLKRNIALLGQGLRWGVGHDQWWDSVHSRTYTLPPLPRAIYTPCARFPNVQEIYKCCTSFGEASEQMHKELYAMEVCDKHSRFTEPRYNRALKQAQEKGESKGGTCIGSSVELGCEKLLQDHHRKDLSFLLVRSGIKTCSHWYKPHTHVQIHVP